MSQDEILMHRKNKFLSIGRSKGFVSNTNISDNLIMKMSLTEKVKNYFNRYKNNIFLMMVLVLIFFALVLIL